VHSGTEWHSQKETPSPCATTLRIAGEIKVDGSDELAMRAAFDTLKAQIRRDATAELERPAS
jgi:hypothetical protein